MLVELREVDVVKVYVVKGEHDPDIGGGIDSSWIDSVWLSEESAVEHLDKMTGTTKDKLDKWWVKVNPESRFEGDCPFDVYTIEESEMHG